MGFLIFPGHGLSAPSFHGLVYCFRIVDSLCSHRNNLWLYNQRGIFFYDHNTANERSLLVGIVASFLSMYLIGGFSVSDLLDAYVSSLGSASSAVEKILGRTALDNLGIWRI